MQKRSYTRIKAVEAEILRMHTEGETHRPIAEAFGLEREQVKKFLKRHREKQAMLWERESNKPKGTATKGWTTTKAESRNKTETLAYTK